MSSSIFRKSKTMPLNCRKIGISGAIIFTVLYVIFSYYIIVINPPVGSGFIDDFIRGLILFGLIISLAIRNEGIG